MKSLLGLFLLLILTSQAAAKWSTTTFEIVEGNPHYLTPGASTYDAQSSGLDSVELGRISDYMSKVARELESFGFPEPNISTRSSNGAFRIFLGGASGNLGVYTDSKKYPVQTLIIDPANADVAKGGVLTSNGWITLSHELFHAVQENCAYDKSVAASNLWISEGTADAIGRYCAEKFSPLPKSAFKWTTDHYGAREYYKKLVTPRRADSNAVNRRGYRTHSFWRYLAQVELRSASSPVQRAKSGLIFGEDEWFSYLARLLKSRMNPGTNALTSIRWLDKFLKTDSNFGGGLYKHFPEFLNTYGDIKYHPPLNRPAVFLDTILGEESETKAVKPGVEAEQVVVIPPVAGERLRVNVASKTTIIVTAKAYKKDSQSSDALDCKSLHLGLIGRDSPLRPGVVTVQPNGQGIATWNINVPAGTSTLLLVNTALEPRYNVGLKVELSFLQGRIAAASPAGKVEGPAGPVTSFEKKKARLAFEPPEGYKMAAAMQADAEEIALGYFPLVDQNAGSLVEMQQKMAAMSQQQEAVEYSGVPNIEIPGLKPDQTGSFNNAIITVDHGQFGRLETTRYDEALGQDVGDGTVTITEHTALSLRGTFTGTLRDGQREVRGPISGDFFIPLPILGRDDVRLENDHIVELSKANVAAGSKLGDKTATDTAPAETQPREPAEGSPRIVDTKGRGEVRALSSKELLLERFRSFLKKKGARDVDIEARVKDMESQIQGMSEEEIQQMMRVFGE